MTYGLIDRDVKLLWGHSRPVGHIHCFAVDTLWTETMAKTLGDFETLLLLAVVRLRDQAYGATIHREIETRTGRSIAVGAVYTGLARLERARMVTAALGEPTAERGGRRKKFYRLEPEGSAALALALQTHHRMTEGIEEELELLTARHARDR